MVNSRCVTSRTNGANVGAGWVCAAARPLCPEDIDPDEVQVVVEGGSTSNRIDFRKTRERI